MTAGPVLGVIPARGGSKGVPGKNIRALAGKPLLQYTVDAGRASGVIDRLVLSTDSEEIAEVGRALGIEVPFLRPAELSGDAAPMLPVLEHAVRATMGPAFQPAIIVLLQPTSPLRRPDHVRAAVSLLRETGGDSVVTVLELPRHLSPDYVMRVEDGRLVPFLETGARVTRRQDARAAFVRDGTVYTCWTRVLLEHHSLYGADCRPLVVPAGESITIDTLEDWAEAERRLGAASR